MNRKCTVHRCPLLLVRLTACSPATPTPCGRYGHGVDWWSLGVVTFIMLSGKYPHSKGHGKLKLDCSADDRYIMWVTSRCCVIEARAPMPEHFVKRVTQKWVLAIPSLCVYSWSVLFFLLFFLFISGTPAYPTGRSSTQRRSRRTLVRRSEHFCQRTPRSAHHREMH